MRARRAAALFGLLLATAACGGGGEVAGSTTSTAPDPTTTTAATDAGSTTTTADGPTTSTIDPDAPPALVQTGDDYVAILQSLHGYIQWLGMHPDPALVGTIAVPGSPDFLDLTDSLTALSNAGARWDQPQESLSDFVLTTQTDSVAIVSAIATTNRSARALDGSGQVLATAEGGPLAARLAFQLRQGPDGLWRLEETLFLSEVQQ